MANSSVSKAEIDRNFEKQLKALAAHAAEEVKRTQGIQVVWFRPFGWDGNPFDYAGLHAPFDRRQANEQMVAAMADPANPGTTGDVVASIAMIEKLAVMERAFKVRHTLRRCRAAAHAAGRYAGHANDLGPVIQLNLEYVRSVLRQAKSQQ